MTTNGWDIPGRSLGEQRSVSMTTTTPPQPPTDCWTTNSAADYKNTPPPSPSDQEVWKSLRLAFLDPYTLQVSEEGNYRVWRWLGAESTSSAAFQGRRVAWTERRPLEDPEPLTAGLWPADD